MHSKYNATSNGYIVVGDIHGDLNQLLHPLFIFISHLDKYQKIIYLGDYSDRGFNTPRIYEIISALHACNELRDRIILLKGNHECANDCTYDTIREILTGDHTPSDYRMTSYMYSQMNALDLDIVYYDDILNIVFSHSPLSRPLSEILKMNATKHNNEKNYANTTTDDKPHAKMEYQNIHGHDHKLSSTNDIRDFENGELKMISIDGDASIAFDLFNKRCDLISSFDRFNYNSNVTYLSITSDIESGTWKYEIRRTVIPLTTKMDINSMPLTTISSIIDHIINSSGKLSKIDEQCIKLVYKCISGITLKKSYDEFVKFYLQEFPDDPEFKHVFNNVRVHSMRTVDSNKGVHVYFSDVPREVYRMIGIDVPMPRNELTIFYYLNKSVRSQTIEGGNRPQQFAISSIMIILQTLILITIISCMVSYYAHFMISQSNQNQKYSQVF